MHSCQSSSILQFSFKWRITFKIHIYKFQADINNVMYGITSHFSFGHSRNTLIIISIFSDYSFILCQPKDRISDVLIYPTLSNQA